MAVQQNYWVDGVSQGSNAGAAGGSGVDPNYYASLIQSDPYYQQVAAMYQAQAATDAASRAAGIGRLLAQYGEVPDVNSLGLSKQASGFLNQDVTDLVRQLAAKNTAAGLSTVAQLNYAHTNDLRHIRQALAARGALQSGELGYNLGQEEHNYNLAKYNAQNALISAISGTIGNYMQAELQRQLAAAAAAAAAAGRANDGGGYGGGGYGGGGGGGGGGGNPTPTTPTYSTPFSPGLPVQTSGGFEQGQLTKNQPYVPGMGVVGIRPGRPV